MELLAEAIADPDVTTWLGFVERMIERNGFPTAVCMMLFAIAGYTAWRLFNEKTGIVTKDFIERRNSDMEKDAKLVVALEGLTDSAISTQATDATRDVAIARIKAMQDVHNSQTAQLAMHGLEVLEIAADKMGFKAEASTHITAMRAEVVHHTARNRDT